MDMEARKAAALLLLLVVLVGLAVLALKTGGAGIESGADRDARVVATKQAQIDECAASGGYPALDPAYVTAVYCSRTPFYQR